MKTTTEYYVWAILYDPCEFKKWKLIQKSNSPITFTDIESLKDKNVMHLFFMHEEDKFDDSGKRIEHREIWDKKYTIGTEYKYNDIPEDADFNSLPMFNVQQLKDKNPRCSLSRQNIVFLLEKCGGVPIDNCKVEVISPENLDNIAEINQNEILQRGNAHGNA